MLGVVDEFDSSRCRWCGSPRRCPEGRREISCPLRRSDGPRRRDSIGQGSTERGKGLSGWHRHVGEPHAGSLRRREQEIGPHRPHSLVPLAEYESQADRLACDQLDRRALGGEGLVALLLRQCQVAARVQVRLTDPPEPEAVAPARFGREDRPETPRSRRSGAGPDRTWMSRRVVTPRACPRGLSRRRPRPPAGSLRSGPPERSTRLRLVDGARRAARPPRARRPAGADRYGCSGSPAEAGIRGLVEPVQVPVIRVGNTQVMAGRECRGRATLSRAKGYHSDIVGLRSSDGA